jgi:tRNA (guanine37-N1)-methyltransferase
MAVIDSITRLLPKALGNNASAQDESHSVPGILEYPQYTKPETFTAEEKKYKVPKILLSGHHQKIEQWREKKKKRSKII